MAISEYIDPTAPIRFITAFAFERHLFGVRSGISATAGDLYIPMENKRAKSAMRNIAALFI